MSRVALVGPEIEENLSLRYLASSLAAAGHEAELVPLNSTEDFGSVLEVLVALNPPIIGLSLAFQWRAQDFLALAVALRQRGWQGHLTAGGHFGPFACREILSEFPEIDTICRQEAEETLVRLVDAVVSSQDLSAIPGLALRDDAGEIVLTALPSLPDLSRLPYPDRRGPPAACFDHPISPLVGSRGCYANCSFCCIAAWHEQTLPGRRYRVREPDDVAAEMVAMQRERGVDIFVFHDDNFFLPGHAKNLARFHALADALERRGIGPFATVVKARPTDVEPEVFRVLVDRLNCIRCYVGIETDADQGLRTLQRWAHSRHNHEAMRIVRELGLYVCFNLLMFDPDTTLDDLERNIHFIEEAGDYPHNFGRVELYAGTPLLSRMASEGRTRGTWIQWDYDLGSPEVERVFAMAMRAFHARNFGSDALNNRIMGTRFDLEVVRHFHPELWDPAWMHEGRRLTRRLALDSAAALSAIVARVRDAADPSEDEDFARTLAVGLREVEVEVRAGAVSLARTLAQAVGRGAPLTDLGDRVATPLQTSRAAGRSLAAGEALLPSG